jgi:ferritin-like protein
MTPWIRLTLAVLVLTVTACSGEKAKELLETAEFEERQHNESHAKELYEDIVRLYPSSKEADTARERLAALSRGR